MKHPGCLQTYLSLISYGAKWQSTHSSQITRYKSWKRENEKALGCDSCKKWPDVKRGWCEGRWQRGQRGQVTECTGKIPKRCSYCINILSENTVTKTWLKTSWLSWPLVSWKKYICMYGFIYVLFSFFQSIFLNPKDSLYCQFNKTKRFGWLPWDKSACMSTSWLTIKS